ncbi:uncharacterized protein LOC123697998 [Colias croceus]|uniref:uncharacterized protein LOC123697998 n=1 Tax=Colias crocea TaxID=72248 RepID=UPI001E27E345|nr:uncharacterized protein LOC123697998 [Colias croceus]
MDEKTFVWTPELTLKLFELRFEHEWLFKKKKQPWLQFRNILIKNGFPEEITIGHVRKKWGYTYDAYKIAKKVKNKEWKYYKLFDKHFGKTKVLDKYESWSDEWRLKLIICITEARQMKFDNFNMWRTVEHAMRCQDLPLDCCVHDMKGLWQHLKITFNRKHRLKIKKGEGGAREWPLYEQMLEYYKKVDPSYVERLETLPPKELFRSGISRGEFKRNMGKTTQSDFQWSKDITESFIQIRLQNDWIFREQKWAWNKMRTLLVEENGFPSVITSRDLSRKWACTFADYQKAKATNNKTWLYYSLFELYLGEGSLSLNPLTGWQEEWILNLIKIRSDLDHIFSVDSKNENHPWREVEKALRSMGLPLDHSLLDLPEIWAHLLKSFKWKQKFLNKGILNEHWPYYNAMASYMQTHEKIKEKQENDFDYADDDYEDDMKLIDVKKLIKPKCEYLDVNLCRSCSNEEGCVDLFEHCDEDGVDLASKLRLIGGIEVDQTDTLPHSICLHCMQELETAYNFRRKCQDVDKQMRGKVEKTVKIEISLENNIENNNDDYDDTHNNMEFDVPIENENAQEKLNPAKEKPMKIKKKYPKYDYWKVCEVCGKNTRNLVSHLDSHATEKLYSCEICNKKFKFKSGLIIHKAVHDPTPKKTCEVCGKTFHILAQYRRHFQYHANERKFECETCGKRFNSADILRVHARSHTDERPFSCPECGKTFRTAGCVSRHRRIVHHIRKSKVKGQE